MNVQSKYKSIFGYRYDIYALYRRIYADINALSAENVATRNRMGRLVRVLAIKNVWIEADIAGARSVHNQWHSDCKRRFGCIGGGQQQ